MVDDGSTDESRNVIASYDEAVIAVLKENGGQASAFNQGFAVSHGDVVVFLDADDALLPTAVEQACELLTGSNDVKVHWPLWVMDEEGRQTGHMFPRHPMPEGNMEEFVVQRGPHSCVWPPTSGNAWARRFVESVLPIPETDYRICADAYLCLLVPFFGPMRSLAEPQALYRIHRGNRYSRLSFDEKLKYDLARHEFECGLLADFCRRRGTSVDPKQWKQASRYHQLQLAVEELTAVIPAEASFILVDHATWEGPGELVAGRRRLPFTERNGEYWGPPLDDVVAVKEVERLNAAGARFVVFTWEAFWWLKHYSGLRKYLYDNFRCVLQNSRLVVFDLRR